MQYVDTSPYTYRFIIPTLRQVVSDRSDHFCFYYYHSLLLLLFLCVHYKLLDDTIRARKMNDLSEKTMYAYKLSRQTTEIIVELLASNAERLCSDTTEGEIDNM
jgi:hypothetical protein